jgi:hypothetical protein
MVVSGFSNVRVVREGLSYAGKMTRRSPRTAIARFAPKLSHALSNLKFFRKTSGNFEYYETQTAAPTTFNV